MALKIPPIPPRGCIFLFRMDLPDFAALLTPAGQEALHAAEALAPQEVNFLRDFTALSRACPPPLARAALETAILRREAAAKFPESHNLLYFTREALEQATPAAVSAYRAARFAPFSRLADLGCSTGGDTLALAALAPTLALDWDPLRLAMARANLAALGLAARALCLQADLTRPLPASPETALFFDPARREAGRRAFSVQAYQPPLAVIEGWLPRFPALGVKISPGVNLAELTGYQAEVEFISLEGKLKEAVLWFGPLRTAARRATVLPGPHTLTASPSASLYGPTSPPRATLYEPDPAVLRAGLVTTLGEQLEAAQLDPDIAYLTADTCRETPFARAWEVEAWMPFHLKKLRAYLRERRVGRVTVKKRGSPLTPEGLARDLRLKGENERVLFLTHWDGSPVVVVGLPSGLPQAVFRGDLG